MPVGVIAFLGVVGGGGGHAPPLFPRAHNEKPDAHAASGSPERSGFLRRDDTELLRLTRSIQ